MATNQDEVLDLKRRARRRLIGAIALLLFLVIVPPWIMDLEPKPVETSLKVEIPKPDTSALPATPIAPAQTAASPEAPVESDSAPAEAAEKSEAPAAVETPAPPQQQAPAAEPPAPPAPASVAKPVESKQGEAYIIPLATLASKSNVKDLQAKVALAGIKSYTEPIKTASGVQTRVRAGPFKTEAEAEKAHAQLRGLGLKPGKVTTR
jgi:DedD protein